MHSAIACVSILTLFKVLSSIGWQRVTWTVAYSSHSPQAGRLIILGYKIPSALGRNLLPVPALPALEEYEHVRNLGR